MARDMHSLAIYGSEFTQSSPESFSKVELAGTPLLTEIVTSPPPEFSPTAGDHRRCALLEIAAFSCNYRDLGLILGVARGLPDDRYFTIGSEFVGTVIDVGSDVQTLAPGHRVIGDGSWPGSEGVPGGLPTNHGSRSVQIIDERKLITIPASMEDSVAAGFSIGAQTSYSMLRTLGLSAPSTVLVTAAGSNTSMFAIQVARNAGHRVVATTSSASLPVSDVARLAALGVDELFVIERALPTFADHEALRRAGGPAGFDAVIDPFFDVYLGKVMQLMAHGGRYVTCGLADQYSDLGDREPARVRPPSLSQIMIDAMIGGIHIIGNCLGTRDDLRKALRDYADGHLDVVIDSMFKDGDAAGFLDRTFNSDERFGKVIYLHNRSTHRTSAS